MGPDLNLTEKATSIVVSGNKESVAPNQEKEGMQGNIGLEVDIVECVNSGDHEIIDVESEDATEYSSSFGDTISGDENDSIVNDEVKSPLSDPRLFGALSDESNGQFQMGFSRNRRLTDRWRSFIHPLMWRCKWLEIKLKQLKSQELKYERELAKYDQSNQFEFENLTSEGFDAKSRAFHSKAQRKVMKRRKRKRVEDTTDVASYMSQHNIFSYYESKKSIRAAAFGLADDGVFLGNKTINDNGCDDGCPLQSRDRDNLAEQILCKIELLRSRIHILKTRMHKVVSESPQKFSSINMLSSLVPSDALNNSENPHYAEKDYRNSLQFTTSQDASECVMWDNVMPDSALSDHGVSVRDMIRSMSQRLLAISSENIEAEILIPNQAAEEALRGYGSAISLQAEKPHILIEKSKLETVSLGHAPRDNLQMNTSLEPNAHPPFFKSKQTDNERTSEVQKTDLGQWSRISSG